MNTRSALTSAFLAIALCAIIATPGYSRNAIASVEIASVDASNFPSIDIYVSMYDNNNLPVSGVFAEEVYVKEGERELADYDFEEVDRGVYVSIVIDAGAGIDSLGGTFVSRLQEMKTVVQSFVANMGGNDYAQVVLVRPTDQVSILQDFTNERSLITDAVNGLNLESDEFLTFGLEGVDQALNDLIIVAPESGFQAVLMLSMGIQDSGRQHLGFSVVEQRAVDLGIPIYTLLFKQDFVPFNLDRLAETTGGSFAHYNRAGSEEPILGEIFLFGDQYLISYQTSNPSGNRNLTVGIAPESASTPFDDFSLTLDPNPAATEVRSITVNGGESILRQPDEDSEEALSPSEVDVVVDFQWPDGYGERGLKWIEFIVDGEIQGNRIEDISPGESVTFSWNVNRYNETGEYPGELQVRFEDEMGFEVTCTPTV